MSKYLKLMRVKHYLKNGLIFLPLIFSGQMFNLELILKTSIAFVAFSLSASVIYIINDLNDIENDRNHSTKKTRPLASGAISVKKAILLAIILFILSILMNYIIAGKNLLLWSILLLYIFSNFLYSKGLKNIALLDVFILVLGYILRLFYGALTIDVIVSSWLYLTVTTISFYLGFGKRRNEIKRQGSDTRKVLNNTI